MLFACEHAEADTNRRGSDLRTVRTLSLCHALTDGDEGRVRQGHPGDGGGIPEDLGEFADATDGAEARGNQHSEEEAGVVVRTAAVQ
eukprot:354656-Chlamydomonas_euryale.AAC.5